MGFLAVARRPLRVEVRSGPEARYRTPQYDPATGTPLGGPALQDNLDGCPRVRSKTRVPGPATALGCEDADISPHRLRGERLFGRRARRIWGPWAEGAARRRRRRGAAARLVAD